MTPALSICTVNWNTRTDLRALLQSVRADAPDAEVIVVDNGSTDGSAEMVRGEFPGVRLIANPDNRGYARATNQALAAAGGQYLFLLNPDSLVRPGCSARLRRFLDEHPRAGAAGPRVLNPDGSLQPSARRFPTFAAGLFRHTPLGWLLPGNRFTRAYLMQEWDHTAPREVEWLSGAALMLRRVAVEQVGALDERFFMFCEDVDWAYRARAAGWERWYVPDAVVVHRIGRATDQAVFPMVRAFHRSMLRFYWKHYAPHWPGPLRWLPALAIRLREAFVLTHSSLLWLRSRLRRPTPPNSAAYAAPGTGPRDR